MTDENVTSSVNSGSENADETTSISGAAQTEAPVERRGVATDYVLGTPKGGVIHRVLNLMHTAEADVAADEAKLLAFVKAEIYKL